MDMTIREIDIEITKLRNLRRELELKQRASERELARELVGKCYKDKKNNMLKIVGVPQVILSMYGETYNQHQFPAIWLQCPEKIPETCIGNSLDNAVPFYCDTVFCNKWVENEEKCDDGLTEISREEFEDAFNVCLERFKELVLTKG